MAISRNVGQRWWWRCGGVVADEVNVDGQGGATASSFLLTISLSGPFKAKQEKRARSFGGWLSGTWLHDDLEVGVAERDLADVPLRGPRLVGDLFEVDDQGLLDREYRVRLDVLAARHEDVRGQRSVAGGLDDEVDVRGAERVPAGRDKQLADRAVGRDRIVARDDGAEPELAVGVG